MDKKNNVKITVVIPVYNTELYFERCISSILNQSLRELEIIVVNDCSEGSIDVLIKKYLHDKRVKYLKQNNQLSLGGVRNLGLSIAQGEYIHFCDSDDWLDLMTLEELYDKISEDNADIAVCSLQKDFGSGVCRELSLYNHQYLLNGITALHILTNQYEFGIKISPSPTNKIYNVNFLKRNSITFYEKHYYEESAFNFKAFLHANKIVIIKYGKYHYYNRNGSILQSISLKHIEDLYYTFNELKLYLIHKNIFENFKKDYYSFLERYFNIVIDQIFNNETDNVQKKKLLKCFLKQMNILVPIDDFLEYTQIDKLRLYFQPIRVNPSPI